MLAPAAVPILLRPETAHAFYLADESGRGQRYCRHYSPRSGGAVGAVLHVPPFAEEMNKCRRMAARQAKALANVGFGVLQIDLLGCGDSSGDFADATWSDWLGDVTAGVRWLRREHPGAPIWLWGLRAGCLLAAEAAAMLDADCGLLLWQPSISGSTVLQQFLRLKLANGLVNGQAKGITAQLREDLSQGRVVEVAGYVLSPDLAKGLEAARLAASPRVQQVVWLETSTREDPKLAAASAQAIGVWQAAGVPVLHRAVTGPAFWQTTEIEDATELITATVAAMVEQVTA